MEMKKIECFAVENLDSNLATPQDSLGRFVITPHPLTLEGQRNVLVDLQPGETLEFFLKRNVPGIISGAWTVSIGGITVPQEMWSRVRPKHGQLIACRAVVARQVVHLVAMAALTYFTLGANWGVNAAALLGSQGLLIAQTGVFMLGSTLVNKVLAPSLPKPYEQGVRRQVFSLNGQRNNARPYAPLPVLWGEVRVTPDLAGSPYAWFEGDEQYVASLLLGGINVHSASELSIGDTPIDEFRDVSTYHNGFSGMPSSEVPLHSNVDTVAGGELIENGVYVTRVSSIDAILLGIDLEYQLFHQGDRGFETAHLTLDSAYRPVGSEVWLPWLQGHILSNASQDMRRESFTLDVPLGQYEVRVRRRESNGAGGRTTRQIGWTSLRTVQPDSTDYMQWGRIGIKIGATGQINGSLDTLRVTYRARPLTIWNGSDWAIATTREEGLSNPGAIILQTLRGIYSRDAEGGEVLQFGFGMSDEQIDIDGLKAFMLHCQTQGYYYDRWLTDQTSLGTFCDEVALAGMGQFTWTDGSRPTVAFVSSGQPLSAVVNMANMAKASFSVDYSLSSAADGIEFQYIDRAKNWENQTLRVMAPGITTMLNPARVTGEGITSEAHAAILARYHLAQSLYQFKTINYQADIEHLDYRRLSLLSISHDLTQWGFGGRVLGAEIVGGNIVLQLDDIVPPLPTPHLGLRIPGEREYRVWPISPMKDASDRLTLVGSWPEGIGFPGDAKDNPAHDTLWCADFKPTPGYRVRVVAIEPESDLTGAAVTCVPEDEKFWDYVLNGSYTPSPNESSIPELGRPSVRNLRVQEQVHLQGDTEWYQLHLQWEVEGKYDHAQVWAGRDGSALRLMDGNAASNRSAFRIDGAGEWLIEVRPFNSAGLLGGSAAVVFVTQMTGLPPRNPAAFVVQRVEGGMRRFAWAYSGDRPAALAGVKIRYMPGEVQLSLNDWNDMTPLGDADDIYNAQFETTKPGAGLWTFGLRAIDTAGQLADGIQRYVAALEDVFDNIIDPDFTAPPVPEGLAAEGALASVMVTYDRPAYAEGHGHARTHIYAAKVGAERKPLFEEAVEVAESYAGPVSFSSEPASVWFIWARHESKDGVLSEEVAGPVEVKTGADIGGLLEALQGQVDATHLTRSLAQPIEKVPRLLKDSELQAEVTLENMVAAAGSRAEIRESVASIATDERAAAQRVSALRTLMGQSDAVIRQEFAVLSDGATAQAQQLSSLGANLGSTHAQLQQEAQLRADQTGHLGGLYSVRMQLDAEGRNVSGGFSLSGTSSESAGATIDFGVLANKFFVAAPAGSGISSSFHFTLQTTAVNANGVYIPAGLYVDSAFINNVNALWGRFGTLVADSVQATSISASQLTAGNGVIGGRLQSANYMPGASGWLLRPDGEAELAGAKVSGTIYSTSGVIGGITINGNGLNSGSYNGYAWPDGYGTGFHLGRNGLLLGNYNSGSYFEVSQAGDLLAPGLSISRGVAEFSGRLKAASGTFSGELSAASGTFSGELRGATGTFSGTLSANAIAVIDTIHIAGNAITIPVYVDAHNEVKTPGIILVMDVPAFGSESLCFINFGVHYTQTPNGATTYSIQVESTQISGGAMGGPGGDDHGWKSDTFCFGCAFKGNGQARRVTMSVRNASSVGSRYMSAVVHKR